MKIVISFILWFNSIPGIWQFSAHRFQLYWARKTYMNGGKNAKFTFHSHIPSNAAASIHGKDQDDIHRVKEKLINLNDNDETFLHPIQNMLISNIQDLSNKITNPFNENHVSDDDRISSYQRKSLLQRIYPLWKMTRPGNFPIILLFHVRC